MFSYFINISESLKKETVFLKDIGKLSLNGEEKVVFEPDNSKNFLKDSFGLSSLNVKRAVRSWRYTCQYGCVSNRRLNGAHLKVKFQRLFEINLVFQTTFTLQVVSNCIVPATRLVKLLSPNQLRSPKIAIFPRCKNWVRLGKIILHVIVCKIGQNAET